VSAAIAVPPGAEHLWSLIRAALPRSERDRPLTDDDCLADLGIGSLRLLSVIMSLEDDYGLSPEVLSDVTTRSTLGALRRFCAATTASTDAP